MKGRIASTGKGPCPIVPSAWFTPAVRSALVSSSVQVAYGTDVRQLQPRLEAAVAKVPRVVGDPGPSVQLATFSADGMDLNVNFWIRDSENGQGNVRSDVNLVVLEVLRAEGVEIPFPQRVVHAMVSKEPVAGSVSLEGQVPSAGPEAAKAGASSPP